MALGAHGASAFISRDTRPDRHAEPPGLTAEPSPIIQVDSKPYWFHGWFHGWFHWNGISLRYLLYGDMAMDQYLYIPSLGGWTSINPSYFDVNYRGIGFWPIPISRWNPVHNFWRGIPKLSAACFGKSRESPWQSRQWLPCHRWLGVAPF